MKKLILAGGLAIAATAAQAQYLGTGSNPNSHLVQGYAAPGGTYMQPHQQTNPNSTQRRQLQWHRQRQSIHWRRRHAKPAVLIWFGSCAGGGVTFSHVQFGTWPSRRSLLHSSTWHRRQAAEPPADRQRLIGPPRL